MAIVSGLLKSFVVERAWLSPERAEALIRDAGQHGALALACDGRLDLGEIVACLEEIRANDAGLPRACTARRALRSRHRLPRRFVRDAARQGRRLPRRQARPPLLALLKRAGIPHWLAPCFRSRSPNRRRQGRWRWEPRPRRRCAWRFAASWRASKPRPERKRAASPSICVRSRRRPPARKRTLAEAMITLDEEGAAAKSVVHLLRKARLAARGRAGRNHIGPSPAGNRFDQGGFASAGFNRPRARGRGCRPRRLSGPA